MFFKISQNFLCQSLFFNKVADLRPATLLKKRLWHRCFPVNFAKFGRTPFLQNSSGWLLLKTVHTLVGFYCFPNIYMTVFSEYCRIQHFCIVFWYVWYNAILWRVNFFLCHDTSSDVSQSVIWSFKLPLLVDFFFTSKAAFCIDT